MTMVTITRAPEGNAHEIPTQAVAAMSAALATSAWDRVVDRHEAALAEMRTTRAASCELTQQIDAEVPMPPELVISRRPDGSPLRAYFSRGMIEQDSNLSLEKKFALLLLLMDYDHRRREACKRLNWSDVDDLATEAYSRWQEALDAVGDEPAPHVTALEYKARLLLLEQAFSEEGGELTQSKIGEMLHEEGATALCARLYQDIARLAGASAEITDYKGFDPEAWLDDFESKPGCSFVRGSPTFNDDLAYDAPLINDRDFLVTDPDVIARYKQHHQAHDPIGFAECHEADPDYGTRPFIAFDARIDWLFDNKDPRRAEWLERCERFTDQNYALRDGRLLPTHFHLWNDLEPWQRTAVKACALEREEQAELDKRLLAAE